MADSIKIFKSIMSEICCGLVSGADSVSAATSEISPRSARRRRMEIRRFRFVSSPADSGEFNFSSPSTGELKRKRSRLEENLHVSPPGTPLTGAADTHGAGKEARSRSGSACQESPISTTPPQLATVTADPCPRYGITSVCGRRRDMEDSVAVRPDFIRRDSETFHYFGVFDGHGCSHVAVSCKDRMHEVVAEELGAGPPPPSDAVEHWRGAMERSFNRMDAEVVYRSGEGGVPVSARCRCELQMPKCDHVGSTAVVAVVTTDSVVVANCGDSRAVLCRGGVPIPLSVDHKPDRPDELERIEAAGGRVIYWDGARVLGVLAMSRAIGDGYLKPFVTSEPEVTITERSSKDECLIMASDGLWDVVTNEMACDIVRMCLRSAAPASGSGCDATEGSDKACSDAAMLLTKLALARQSADNVSVVVVDLRRVNS